VEQERGGVWSELWTFPHRVRNVTHSRPRDITISNKTKWHVPCADPQWELQPSKLTER